MTGICTLHAFAEAIYASSFDPEQFRLPQPDESAQSQQAHNQAEPKAPVSMSRQSSSASNEAQMAPTPTGIPSTNPEESTMPPAPSKEPSGKRKVRDVEVE